MRLDPLDVLLEIKDDFYKMKQAFHRTPPNWALAEEWGMHGERCGDCGAWCTIVRPGKTQCDYCFILGYEDDDANRAHTDAHGD